MRISLAFLAMAVLGACAPQIQPRQLPALGAVPENCQPVLWTVDSECRRISYHRCEGDSADRHFTFFDMPGSQDYVYEYRSHGLAVSAIAVAGQEWEVRNLIAPGNAAALLAGRSTTISEISISREDVTSRFRIGYRPSGEAITVDGITMARFEGRGIWQPQPSDIRNVVGEIYYVEEVGMFVEGRFEYHEPAAYVADFTPLRMSLTGPIAAECVPGLNLGSR